MSSDPAPLPPDPSPAGSIDPVGARALVAVVLGLADDLGVDCAVVVVDRTGGLLVGERPETVARAELDRALGAARSALRGGGAGPEADGVVLEAPDGARAALGVSGGPDGFPAEACRAAAEALRLH